MGTDNAEPIEHTDYVHFRRKEVEALVKLTDDRWTAADEALKRIRNCLREALRRDVFDFDVRVARRMAELHNDRDSAA